MYSSKFHGKKLFYTLYVDEKRTCMHSELLDSQHIIAMDDIKKTKDKDGKIKETVVKRYLGFDSVEEIEEFIKKIPEGHRHFYEYRRKDRHFKPFFDIDYSLSPTKKYFPPDLLEKVKYQIGYHIYAMFFKGYENKIKMDEDDYKDIYVYTSTTKDKLSYHITLPNFCMKDINLMRRIRDNISTVLQEIYRDLGQPIDETVIDKNIYKESGLFRLLRCSKLGKTNVKIPLSTQPDVGDLQKSMTTVCDGGERFLTEEDLDPSFVIWTLVDDKIEDAEINVENKEVKFSLDKEPKMKVEKINFILRHLSDDRANDYGDWVNIAFILHNEGCPFELFDEFSQRSSDKYDEKAVFDLWNSIRGTRQKPLTIATLLYYLKKDNRGAFNYLKLNSDKPDARILKAFNKMFTITDESVKNSCLKYEIFEERYLKKERYQVPGDILVKSYLGTGKTECLAALPEISDQTKNIIILTNRRRLAKEFAKRFRGGDTHINCYLDYDSKKHTCQFFNRIIIQPESLWRIDDDVVYDLLIIDECESVFSQFNAPTMKTRDIEREKLMPTLADEIFFDRHSEFVHRWKRLVKHTNKIILCDAFLSQRTIDVYKDLGRAGTLLQNTYKPPPRKAIPIPIKKNPETGKESISPLINKALDELHNKKNIFIVVSSVAKLNDFVEAFRPYNFIGKTYSSKINAGKLLNFDCKKEWKACNYVIITTTITTGINFDLEHFDSVFVYFHSTPLVRDLFQSIMRVRHLKENVLYYTVSTHVYGEKFNNIDHITIKDLRDQLLRKTKFVNENIPIIKVDTLDSLITIASYNTFERNAQSYSFTYKNIIAVFFTMCNYVHSGDKDEPIFTEDIEKEIPEDFMEEYDEAFKRTIKLCDAGRTLIRERIDNGEATVLDMNVLRMDYFMTKFQLDRNSQVLKNNWPIVYYTLCKDPILKAQITRADTFFKGNWFDPTINTTLDTTNPRVIELSKLFIMGRLYEELKLTFDPTKAEVLARNNVERIPTSELCDWAKHHFNMKDQRTVKGKKVNVDPATITKADNYRYIKHIFSSFSGAKLQTQKPKKVKKINGKNVDVTPYELNYPDLLKIIYDMRENKEAPRSRTVVTPDIIDDFFSADTVEEF